MGLRLSADSSSRPPPERPTCIAQRLPRILDAIPVEEGLKLACQITEALEEAHEKGVIQHPFHDSHNLSRP